MEFASSHVNTSWLLTAAGSMPAIIRGDGRDEVLTAGMLERTAAALTSPLLSGALEIERLTCLSP